MSDSNLLKRTAISMLGFIIIAAIAMLLNTGDIQMTVIAVGSMLAFVLMCIAPIGLMFVFLGRKVFKRNQQ